MNQCSYVMHLDSDTFLPQPTFIQGHLLFVPCAQLFSDLFLIPLEDCGVFGGFSAHCTNSIADLTLSLNLMLLTWDSGNLHPVAVTFFSSPDPMCPLQYPPPWTATVSCISCKQAFGGGGVSTRLDASSPGMTWQWPQSAWHQNSLMGHTLSTTSAHSTRPTPSATMCSRWFPHHS